METGEGGVCVCVCVCVWVYECVYGCMSVACMMGEREIDRE